MIRALLELFITVLAIIVARAVLSSVLKGIANASQAAARQRPPETPPETRSQPSGELHKDPVCGTYVAESTAFTRRMGGQTFYYCSNACREKHALVAR